MSLQKIDKAISGVLDRGMMLRILLRQIVSQLEVDAACILLHDPHLDMLGYGAGEGFKTDNFRHTNLRVGERFAGQVALERRIIHIEDLRKHEADFLKKPDFEREGFLTYFGVPLITKGQVIGVLEVFHRMVFQPDQEWVDFLNTMAGQVAIAIDNINMFTAIQKAHRKLALAYDHTLEGWARALEIRDMETEGHSRRVTRMAVDLARVMGIHGQDLAHFRRGALLHDIGKMAIPDQILRKPGPLNEEEWEIMYRHPRYAYEMLKEIDYLRPALDIPYCHHEKWDGTGYPRGLKGEEIPLAARVFAVVDYWDALTSDRPYRDAWSEEKALAHIREETGKHFDPRVVDVFLMLLEEWRD
jgi:putative nucleotidyltransferase with HDIG domain